MVFGSSEASRRSINMGPKTAPKTKAGIATFLSPLFKILLRSSARLYVLDVYL